MKPLSEMLHERLIEGMRSKIENNEFPGIAMEIAMNFLLTDGVLPVGGLPVESFLKLENWVRNFDQNQLSFTATELKNKTGTIIEKVIAGKTVTIYRHGRAVAEIKPV